MISVPSETQLDPKCRLDLRRHDGATQRVTAEVEEIVFPAEIRQLKHLRPDMGKQHLRFGPRLFALTIIANNGILTEGLSIDLVTLVVGEAIQKYDSRRHHVGR